MKKLLCVLFAILMCVSVLTACKATEAPASEPAAEAPAEAPAEAAEPAAEAAPAEEAAAADYSDLKVCLLSTRVMSQPADINTMEGVTRLKDEMGIDVKVIICPEVAEYYDQMQAVCEEGYDIVYFVYDNFLEAAKKLCKLYPDTLFIGLWVDLKGEVVADNLKALHFRSEQGSFMCGIAAARMTESKKVGFIGGGDSSGIITFLAGYEAGIKYADSEVELMVAFANTFEDPLKGKELALSLYDRGCDVIYQAANQTGLGVFEAAEQVGKYAIGVDVDQSPLAPENIICSSLLDHGYATYDSISQAAMGNFNNEQVFYGLQEGMPVIAINEALVPAEVVAEIAKVQDAIIAGDITIPTTTETR